ncbi:hypothetical protein UNPF46_32190 [Bradyrhizobium sp. UNPF46]|uniref:hypothetical protein n=1 Tax=Bradyrhizobium sp. UNPF46 TaxID=1141168 RepID=UPI0011526EF3|nr:hypothetical protein [Bradyrhizobium sp. UNPF46]TQF26892.1 hypothetical protein UNPF46_32190 [Bradyrhizobium sp. UNPF46]
MSPLPDLVASEITDLTTFFISTGNVAAAWRAYSLARQHSRAVPDVIQAEIDRFAAGLADVAAQAMRAGVDAAHPIIFRAEELGAIWRGDGKADPIGALQRDWRNLSIGAAVARQIENGKKVGAAIEGVAESLPHLNSETVRKAWQKFQRNG